LLNQQADPPKAQADPTEGFTRRLESWLACGEPLHDAQLVPL
jgi:hypothetical protein